MSATALLLMALVTPGTSEYFEYDEEGRLIRAYGNNAQNVRYAYDGNGNVKTITDSLGRVTTLSYDALDRVVTSKDAKNGITSFTYDAGDQVKTVTDPRGKVTTYQRDGFGQVWSQVSPDTGTTAYEYDVAGRQTKMTRADGIVTTYGSDGLGRVTSMTAGGQTHAFTYDTCTNGKGRLCTVTDPTGSVGYTYTPQGWLATQSSAMPASGSAAYAFSYDGMGRVVGIAYPGNVSAGYAYAFGRPTTMTVTVSGATTTVVSGTAYEPFGPAKGWTYGNGLARGYNYDLDGRLTGISAGTGSNVLQSLTYQIDANNAITKITNGSNAALTQTYGYDELGRITTVTASNADQGFTWDANGNRTSHAWGGATDTYITSSVGNRLTSITGPRAKSFSYDGNGNVLAGAGVTYTYDAFNRLKTAVKAGVSTTYAVNGLGQRVHKRVGSVDHWFTYGAGNRLLGEYKAGQAWTQYLYFNGEPVAMVRSAMVSYLHPDHLGRPEIATNGAKAVVWRAGNYAFDRTVTLNTIGDVNIGFPGQYYDAETGLWNNGFRDYDPSTGRYVQSDPIGLAGGLNTYAYVFGNPIKYVDPLGLESPGSFNNGGHQLTWERGSNVRAPDYVRVQASIYVFNASRSFSRSGNTYVAGGVARGYPAPKVQASISFGWLNQCETPEGSQVDDLLSGYGMAGVAGYGGVGGGVTWSPGSGTATELGFGIGGGLSPGEVGVQDGTFGGGW